MNYTKWLLWGIIGGLFLALFIPFIVSTGVLFPSMFFPYITGKNFAFRIIVEIIFGLYVVLAIRDAKYRPRSSWLMWALCAFVVWMGVATILSVDPIKSFWGNFERMDGYITLLHLFLYFIVAGAVLSATGLWEKFLQVSVSASFLQGLLAVAQVFHFFGQAPSSQSGPRADGTFGNAAYLAVYMLFNFFITLFLVAGILKDKKGIRSSWILLSFYGLAIILQLMGVFYTETRGAILGVVCGLVIMAIYIALFGRGRDMLLLRRLSWSVLGVIVILIGAFFALKDTPIVQKNDSLARLASISLSDPTTASRFIIWRMALEGAKDKPIFGWGQENFNFVFNKYYDPAMYSQEQWFDRAHNEFLDWLVAGGAPALILYISLFVLMLWAIFRAKDLDVAQQAVLFGLLAAYVFNNLFVFDNLLSLLYFYSVLALVHMHSKQALPGWMPLSRPGNDRMVAVAAPVVVVAVAGLVWYLNVPAMARAETLITALEPQNPATGAAYTDQDHLDAFTKALSEGELGYQETVEQLFQFASNNVAASTSDSPEFKQQVYNETLAAGQTLEAQRPHDARIELFMGVFLSQFGQLDQAITELNKALADSPDKQQILFQTGAAYLQQGQTDQALALFKKAYDLEPSYADARVMYATGLYYAGQAAAADALLIAGFGTVDYDDDRLLQTYTSLKMYDRVIAIWNARVAASPNDPNTLLGLASAYFQMGDTKDTIATIQKVEAIDPSSKAQMDEVISQIQDGTLTPQSQ